jgi:hypothetical protein
MVGLLIASSALAESGKPGVTVIVRGEPMAAARFQDSLRLAEMPIEFRFVDIPNVPSPPPERDDLEAAVAAARQDYGEANLRPCVARLAAEDLVTAALRNGQREGAARVLFWRAACRVGLGDSSVARGEARRLGTLELQVPPDVGRTTPEVERVVTDELKAAQRLPRVSLRVTSSVAGATVALDGRPKVCVTPCAVEVLPGEHVVRLEADGMVPEVRTLRVDPNEPAELAAALTPAAPELASAQWTAKYAASADIDSAASVRLLARAVRAKRLVFITAETSNVDARLRGVFADDQEIRGYAERYAVTREFDAAVRGLVEDLLVKGSVLQPPAPLYARPLFWTVVAAVAAAAVVGTYFAVSPPPVHTQVHF